MYDKYVEIKREKTGGNQGRNIILISLTLLAKKNFFFANFEKDEIQGLLKDGSVIVIFSFCELIKKDKQEIKIKDVEEADKRKAFCQYSDIYCKFDNFFRSFLTSILISVGTL